MLAYSDAVGKVFYMIIGVSIVVCAAACGMGCVDLRKKRGAVVEKQERGDAAV